MANLCIKTPSSASLVLIFQLLVLRPRPNDHPNWPSKASLQTGGVSWAIGTTFGYRFQTCLNIFTWDIPFYGVWTICWIFSQEIFPSLEYGQFVDYFHKRYSLSSLSSDLGPLNEVVRWILKELLLRRNAGIENDLNKISEKSRGKTFAIWCTYLWSEKSGFRVIIPTSLSPFSTVSGFWRPNTTWEINRRYQHST